MQSMNMQKFNEKILLEDVLAMILIDFGLLRSPYRRISYLLPENKIFVKIWQPTSMTQCAKIIVGFMANVSNVFIKPSQTFFLRF